MRFMMGGVLPGQLFAGPVRNSPRIAAKSSIGKAKENEKKFVSLPYGVCQVAECVGGKFLTGNWLRRKMPRNAAEKGRRKAMPEKRPYL